MKPKPLVTALALATLFFAVLLPPEAYPDGKLAVIICATFVFFISLAERRIAPGYLWGGMGLFALLLLHSLVVSVDTYRSIEFVSVLWAYYCLLGFFLYAGFEPIRPVAISMVVLTIIVSGYGIYQYFWGFDRLYEYIFYSGSEQAVRASALGRIADGRVFSTFALPGTLWGFLVMALPFHAALWRKGHRSNMILAVSGAMLLATGLLTRSFGFLLGLFVLTFVWLLLRHRRAVWNKLTIVLLILTVAGGMFYSARRGVIEGSNPASLRLKNWISAWTVFAANPMGTGLNTYGVTYSRYKLPNANETQYAHNTPVQLLSELGYPVLLLAAGLFLFGVRGWTRGAYRDLSPYVLLALAAWMVHNLVDINVYFPSVGVIGAVLLGVLFRKDPGEPRLNGKVALISFATLGIAMIAFSALVMVSSELQHRAQVEHEENQLSAAVKTLEEAKVVMPLNSSLYHDSGGILLNLYHNRHDPKYLEAATESFERAIALSPAKSGPRIGLSLCLSSANRIEEALVQIRTAQNLDPDNTYAQAIAKLMAQRRFSLLAGKP